MASPFFMLFAVLLFGPCILNAITQFITSWIESIKLQMVIAQWSEVAQSCLTLCDPVDWSLPSFSVHGILQARILEWVTISFSRGSSRPRGRTQVSHIGGRCFNLWATREAELWMSYQNMWWCFPQRVIEASRGGNEEEKLKFYLTSCLFYLYNSACTLQSWITQLM